MKSNIATLKSHICKSCLNLKATVVDPSPHICISCDKKSTLLEDLLSLNSFQLFNVKLSYKINKNMIYKEYTSLQKVVHPDLIYSLKSDEALKEAEKASSLLSKSYHILINDYERGKYLVRKFL